MDYHGLLPFAQSMTSFSGNARLMHDGVLSIHVFCYLFQIFNIWGIPMHKNSV